MEQFLLGHTDTVTTRKTCPPSLTTDVLRPGIVGMRGSTVIRPRPCMSIEYTPLPTTPCDGFQNHFVTNNTTKMAACWEDASRRDISVVDASLGIVFCTLPRCRQTSVGYLQRGAGERGGVIFCVFASPGICSLSPSLSPHCVEKKNRLE